MLAEPLHTTTIQIPAPENGIVIKENEAKSPKRNARHPNITSSSSTNNTSTSAASSSIESTRTDGDKRTKQSTPWVSFQDNLADNYLERGRRINGLQIPLHPLQISGWIAIFGFGVSTFCVLIPALHPDLQIPLFYTVTCLYVVHVISHLAALLIDPSDVELLRQSSKRIVPEFDRTKHAHVIENGRCHLCNIKTSNFRTKHCSVCNKCVAQFDHHCKWLNHCVGGRNYVAFLMCVVSAVITAMVILAAVITELVLYYMKSEWLIIWTANATANVTPINGTDTAFFNQTNSISSTIFNDTFLASMNDTFLGDFVENVTDTVFETASNKTPAAYGGISLRDSIFLAFISALGILAAITVGLLLHLCFFHVYISFLGLTTYEYIRNQRQLEAQQKKMPATTNKTTLNALKKSSTSTQVYFCSHIDPKNLIENNGAKLKHRPASIHCCDTSMQYESSSHNAFYLCSVLHDRPSPILVPSSMAHELTLNSSRASRSKTFHCCSEYKQIVKLSDETSQREYRDESMINNDGSATEASSINEYVKFFEQCTFCSFKLNTTSKRKVSAIEANVEHRPSNHAIERGSKRRWMCCSKVPESPDNDQTTTQINTISESLDQKSGRHHHIHRLRGGTDDAHKSKNGAKSQANGSTKPNKTKNRSSLSTNLKGSNRSRVQTQGTWPLRLRHMLRVFGRCQQPHYAQNSTTNNGNEINKRNRSVSPRRNIKQNQIRPMDTAEQQHERHRQSYDSNHMPNNLHKSASNRRDEQNGNEATGEQVSGKTISMPPPPPVRRKICQAPDIQDLAESLSFVQNPSHHHHHYPSRTNNKTVKEQSVTTNQSQAAVQRPIGVANSRRRRKNTFRTRSPNLSPIHESGYSNPTSPQPCRSSHDSKSSTPQFSHQNEKHRKPTSDRV